MRDERYIRGEIPMTKEEVRALSLSRMEIKNDSIVYDIGAGTGSVTVEAALLARDGHVYAFEQKEEGCRLVRTNCGRFGAANVTVVPGHVPESLAGYPVPDCAFIGGSGGEMERIVDFLYRLNPQIRIVVNVIALESLMLAMKSFQRHGIDPEVTCIQASKAQIRGQYHLMQGMNPIYVLSAGLGNRPRFQHTASDGLICSGVPRVMIASLGSDGGKTIITSGLLALLSKRGLNCAAFKCGPDYIDPMFHRHILEMPGCNLDSFFLGDREVSSLFAKYSKDADIAVIEGVMGYYDGVEACTCQASSYDIARITDTPVILLMDGRKSSVSLAAELKGFREYRKDSRIAGVILNRTSQSVLERVRLVLEEQGVTCLGAVPDCEEAHLESRHLGLTIPAEQKNLRASLEQFAVRLEESLDVEQLLKLAGYTGERHKPDPASAEAPARISSRTDDRRTCRRQSLPYVKAKEKARRMGVARDEAFCFYYQANLDFLKDNGWELELFSPLRDEHLPDGLDGLLFGGGYPEIYAQRLAGNKGMLADIRAAHERGVKILAECGGFLYLHDRLEAAGRMEYDMVGLIHARGFKQDKRSDRFGYVTISGPMGSIRGHEFHYWESSDPGSAMKAKKPVSGKEWPCMYVERNMLAGFPHLYYLSSPDLIRSFLNGEGNR